MNAMQTRGCRTARHFAGRTWRIGCPAPVAYRERCIRQSPALPVLPRAALIELDEPEPIEEYDDDDIEDEEDERNRLTDLLGFK